MHFTISKPFALLRARSSRSSRSSRSTTTSAALNSNNTPAVIALPILGAVKPEEGEGKHPGTSLPFGPKSRISNGTTPASNNKHLLMSGEYYDLLVVVKGIQFRLHKAVICPQGKFFSAACEGGFKESDEGVINLPEDEPRTMWRVLEYLYDGDYEDADLEPDVAGLGAPQVATQMPSLLEGQSPRSRLTNNVLVFHLGDKYGLMNLMSHAIGKVKTIIDGALDTELLEAFSAAAEHPNSLIAHELSREILRRSTYKNHFRLKLRESEGLQNDDDLWNILDDEPAISKTLLNEAMFQVAYFRNAAENYAKALLTIPLEHRDKLVAGPACHKCHGGPLMQYHPLAAKFTCPRCSYQDASLRI